MKKADSIFFSYCFFLVHSIQRLTPTVSYMESQMYIYVYVLRAPLPEIPRGSGRLCPFFLLLFWGGMDGYTSKKQQLGAKYLYLYL